jgi:hypothetical protein
MSKSNQTVEILLVIIFAVITFSGAYLSYYMTSLPNPPKGEISAVSEKL